MKKTNGSGPGALLLIDLQQAIDAPYWAKDGPRNHRNAEATGARLLAAWRRRKWPVIHVRHDSVEPQSAYRPGQPGNAFKPDFEPAIGETVVSKHTGSAFTRTNLEEHLRAAEIEDLYVFGVITNNSVEATVRHGGTLGLSVHLIEDACFTFARRDYAGELHLAETVHAMSLANLDGEYCAVTTAAEVLAGVPGEPLILPYYERPAHYQEHDPRVFDAARRIAGIEHVGSTSVPGCPGKGILDGIAVYEPGHLQETVERMYAMGFQRQPGRDPWPDSRPMLVGAIAEQGAIFRIHAHVLEAGCDEVREMRAFRDHLRSNQELAAAYAAKKREILESGIRDSIDYSEVKGEFVSRFLTTWRASL